MWKLQNIVPDITESSKGTPLWELPRLSFCSYPSHQTSNHSHSPAPCKDLFDASATVSCKSRCMKLSTRCGGQLCATVQTETSQEAEKNMSTPRQCGKQQKSGRMALRIFSEHQYTFSLLITCFFKKDKILLVLEQYVLSVWSNLLNVKNGKCHKSLIFFYWLFLSRNSMLQHVSPK